jgi:hypothetical protein
VKTITAYCGEWHMSVSSAFRELLVEGLKDHVTINMVPLKNKNSIINPKEPTVFCQIAPTEQALKDPNAKLVWIPMWDDARHYPAKVWASIPKNVRIVAFSEHLANRARQVGLPVLHLKYFKNPDQFSPSGWDQEKVLFYWNRTGMIGPEFLEKLCAALSVNRLIFRADIDPIFGEDIRYQLPARINDTLVETLPFLSSKEAYYRALDKANIVIAPRLAEGVGMVFLEALARGSAVFAYDGPTMNEYITHKQDGYLFPTVYATDADRKNPEFSQRVLSKYPVTDLQNWNDITHLDLKSIGQNARQNHQAGYTQWQQSLDEFTKFITEW